MTYDSAVMHIAAQKSARGRSRLAKILDGAVSTAAVFLFAGVWFYWQIGRLTPALLLSALCTSAFTLGRWAIGRLKKISLCEQIRQDIEKSCRIDRLVFMENEELTRLVVENIQKQGWEMLSAESGGVIMAKPDLRMWLCCIQKSQQDKLSATEALGAYHQARIFGCMARVYCTCALSDEAAGLVKRAPGHSLRLYDGDDLLSLIGEKQFLPDEQTLQKYAMIKREQIRSESAKTGVSDKPRLRQLMYSGALLLLLSYISGWKAYYLIFAILCAVILIIYLLRGRTLKAPLKSQ